MFDDSGFGGNSMFDMNHDGHLNSFEADTRDCFLHDKDTFDQIKIEPGKYRGSNNSSGHTDDNPWPFLLVVFAIEAFLFWIACLI